MATSLISQASNAIKAYYNRTFRTITSGNYAYEASNILSGERTFIPNITVDEQDITEYTRTRIQTLARYLENNSPLINASLDNVERYGIADGISVQPATRFAQFNHDAGTLFDRWASSPFCTVNNELNFYQVQSLAARVMVRDGEIYCLLVRDLANPVFKYQIQLIMPDQVGASDDEDDDSYDGVYIDSVGRKVAYGVWSGNQFQKIDASNIVHLQRSTKGARQLRGISDFSSCLNNARDQKDLERLFKSFSKDHGSISWIHTRLTGEAGKGTKAGLKANPATSNPNGQNAKRPVPGNNHGVQRGFGTNEIWISPNEKSEMVSPADYKIDQGFINYLERRVCLALGQPYEFVVNPEKLNGTSMRFVIEHAATYFSHLQNQMIDSFIRRIYVWVISCAIKDGQLSVPDELLNSGAEIYDANFTRPKSITVDAGRVTNAEILLIDNGLLTYDTYFSARGKNRDHEFKTQAEERKMLIQRWYAEMQLSLELSKDTGIPAPNIPWPITNTMLGTPSPNPPIPAPVVTASPDDVESDTSNDDGGEQQSDTQTE